MKNDSKECSRCSLTQKVISVIKIVFTVSYNGSLWDKTLYQNAKHISSLVFISCFPV